LVALDLEEDGLPYVFQDCLFVVWGMGFSGYDHPGNARQHGESSLTNLNLKGARSI
jgi:hypothetical protein